jgi:hypothetical protein
MVMKSILQSLKEKVSCGDITIKEAAIKLHNAGWTNFIDVERTRQLLGLKTQQAKS